MKFILLALFTISVFSFEYFDKYPRIEYKIYEMNINRDTEAPEKPSEVEIEDFIVKIKNTYEFRRFQSIFEIYRNGQKIQSYVTRAPFTHKVLNDSVLVADFNNDGRLDIKFAAKNTAITYAGNKFRKLYLIQNEDSTFDFHYYMDFFHEPERDLNGDGVWEIITRHAYFKNSNVYWVFDTFNFEGGKIKNNGEKFGYTRMSDAGTEEIEDTKEFKKEEWKIYRRPVPDSYSYTPANKTY